MAERAGVAGLRGARGAGTRGGAHSAGQAGEDRAAAWLEERGWRIRERNFRSPAGEIDIIAERDDQVIFVEVKAWKELAVSELEYSIDGRKQSRIARAARFWLAAHRDLAGRRLRFDVIFLSGAGGVRHIEDAFSGGID